MDAKPFKPFSFGRIDALWEYARATITEEEIVQVAHADSHANSQQMVMGLRMSLAAPLSQFNGDHCPELSGIDGPEFAWKYPRPAAGNNPHLRFMGFAIHWSVRVARRMGDIAPDGLEAFESTRLAMAVGQPAVRALLEYFNAALPIVYHRGGHVRNLLLLAYLELCACPDRSTADLLAQIERAVRKELLKQETKYNMLDEARDVFTVYDTGEWEQLLAAIRAMPRRDFADGVERLMGMNALAARVP